MTLDSQSILMATNMLGPEKGLSSSHLGSNCELDTIFEWISSEVNTLLVDCPGLARMI